MASRLSRGAVALATAALLGLLGAPAAGAEDPCDAGRAAVASVELGGESGLGGTGLLKEGGVGGTGIEGDESGIGGTGLHAREGGVGGTGIYGTITAFGSICVNGLRVGYDPDVEIAANGRPADPSALAVGRVVWALARPGERGLRATRIAVYSAVVGRVDRVERARRRIVVLGSQVEVPERAIVFAGPAGDLRALSVGAFVDVSGLRRPGGVVVATRVDHSTAAAAGFEGPRVAELLAAGPRPERLSLEGYLGKRIAPERWRVSGVEVDVTARRERLESAARVWATGRLLADGRLRVEPVAPPERPEPPTPVIPEAEPPEPPAIEPSDRFDLPGPPHVLDREIPERPEPPDVFEPPRPRSLH